jgi:hypothetical protein
VPTGKPVMVDGKIGPGEWSDAAEAEVPGGAGLYIKTSGDFVYVGAVSRRTLRIHGHLHNVEMAASTTCTLRRS